MNPEFLSSDVVVACMDLVGRGGAKEFEIGFVHEDVPSEEAGWYAYAQYQGARIMVQDHRSPSGAALALAERFLNGGTCRCRRPITLSDTGEGCRWKLVGARWEPGCDVPSMEITAGGRGDYAAMAKAMTQPLNREQRRKLLRGGGKS